MHKHAEYVDRLKVARNLAISSFGVFSAKGVLRAGLRDGADFHRLGELHQRARDRFDSYKVLIESVSESIRSGSANAVAESFLEHLQRIESLLTEAGFEAAAQSAIPRLDAARTSVFPPLLELAATPLPQLLHASRLLPPKLLEVREHASTYWYCVKIGIETARTLYIPIEEPPAQIVREIRFAPEHQQAGIAILNYFAVILRDKYPDVPAEVSIKQSGETVTMIISLPDGTQDEVAKTLTDYGLVVSGHVTPKAFMGDEIKALALQQKLELSQMEVRQARELLKLQNTYQGLRIESLEAQVKSLYSLLGQELKNRDSLQQDLTEVISTLTSSKNDSRLIALVEELAKAISRHDPERTRVLLEDMSANEPDVFERLSGFVWRNATAGVVGNAVYDWLKVLWPVLPK